MQSTSPKLSEIAPDFAAILTAALDEQGDEHLAQQVSALNVVALCSCGDEFCGSFYTTAPPKGAWPPSSDTVLVEGETPGMMVLLDVVDGEIAYVEVIDGAELRRRLQSAGIPLAPRVAERHRDPIDDPPTRRSGPMAVAVTDQDVVVESDATWILRNSDYPFWRGLRARLHEFGIDPASTILVDSYEEGPTAPPSDVDEVGVLLTTDERVLRYRFSYAREDWVEWLDLTDAWRETEHAQAIEALLGGPEAD